jgi:site-specific DNA-cytosine methylase
VPEVAYAVNAKGGIGRLDAQANETFIPVQAFYSTESRCDNIPPPNLAPPLKIGSNGGGQAPAVAFDTTQPGDPCHPLAAGAHAPAVAVNFRGREGGTQAELGDEVATALRCAGGTSSKSHALAGMAVRRLTPRECERLQGFSDDFTLIEHRGKEAADGPRYKALGNSMAVPVLRWILQRATNPAQEVCA